MKGISFTHGKKLLNFYSIVILLATIGDRFDINLEDLHIANNKKWA